MQFLLDNLNQLLSGKNKVILGLSGGPDSVFLFMQLLLFKKNNNIDIIAAHVNYNLRGQDSIDDMNFAESLCKSNGIKCEILDTKAFPKEIDGNLEGKARKIRYDFFKELSKKYDTPYIIIAHTLNDLAETYLLKMINNSDPSSLFNMYYEKNMGNITIIRPIINIDKKTILAHLKMNNIPYQIDKTNDDTLYERNFLRNKIFKDLCNRFPFFYRHFFDIYEKEREIHNDFNNIIKNKFQTIAEQFDNFIRFPMDDKTSPYEYFSMIKLALKKIGFSKTTIKAEHFNMFKSFFYKKGGKYLNFSEKYYIFKGYEHIYIYNAESLKNYNYRLLLDKKGVYKIKIPFMSFEYNMKENEKVMVRPYKKGDFVMRNGKKRMLSYYLKKFGIEHFLRKLYPVVEKNGKILILGNIKVFDNDILHTVEVK